MIYIRMREKVEREALGEVRVGDVADVLCDASIDVRALPVFMPTLPGVYTTDALSVVHAIKRVYPDESVTLLGTSHGMLIRRRKKRVRFLALRKAAAFAILLIGSALAIMWFHADVNMMDAQVELYTRLTGGTQPGKWLMAIPYALGVGIGVAMSFALFGKRRVSPMDVKLSEYRDALLSIRAQEGEAHGDPR